jgi:hypothetical protein
MWRAVGRDLGRERARVRGPDLQRVPSIRDVVVGANLQLRPPSIPERRGSKRKGQSDLGGPPANW